MKRAQSLKDERIPESNPVFQNNGSMIIKDTTQLQSLEYLATTIKHPSCLAERQRSVVFKEVREVYTPADYDLKMEQHRRDRERSKSIPVKIRKMSSEVMEHLVDCFHRERK
ncbi:hypothetical protein HDV04_002914 [Boothiomyces sp. JEL0838]|nr:hypothetical protein HDV04_002914 [Boothiomyces sp. JEL0838]